MNLSMNKYVKKGEAVVMKRFEFRRFSRKEGNKEESQEDHVALA